MWQVRPQAQDYLIPKSIPLTLGPVPLALGPDPNDMYMQFMMCQRWPLRGFMLLRSRPLTSFYHSPKPPLPQAASLLSANPTKDQGPLTLSPGYLLLVLPNTTGYCQIANPGKANLGSALFPQSGRENPEGLHPRPGLFHFPFCGGVQNPVHRGLRFLYVAPVTIKPLSAHVLCLLIHILPRNDL